jgi:hypothetical protein
VQGQRRGLAGQPKLGLGGQGVRDQLGGREGETGRLERVEQEAAVVVGHAELGGADHHEPLGPGAVEQVEDPLAARVGEAQQQGAGRIGAELQLAGAAPDPGQAGNQGGTVHRDRLSSARRGERSLSTGRRWP